MVVWLTSYKKPVKQWFIFDTQHGHEWDRILLTSFSKCSNNNMQYLLRVSIIVLPFWACFIASLQDVTVTLQATHEDLHMFYHLRCFKSMNTLFQSVQFSFEDVHNPSNGVSGIMLFLRLVKTLFIELWTDCSIENTLG